MAHQPHGTPRMEAPAAGRGITKAIREPQVPEFRERGMGAERLLQEYSLLVNLEVLQQVAAVAAAAALDQTQLV